MESLRRGISGFGGHRHVSEGEASGPASDNNLHDDSSKRHLSGSSENVMRNTSISHRLQLSRSRTSAETSPQEDSQEYSRGQSGPSGVRFEEENSTSLKAKCKRMVKKTLRSLRSLSVRSLKNPVMSTKVVMSTKALDTEDSVDRQEHDEDSPADSHVRLHEDINSLLMTELCGRQDSFHSEHNEEDQTLVPGPRVSEKDRDFSSLTKEEKGILLSSKQSLTHSETALRNSRGSSRVTFLVPNEATELGRVRSGNLSGRRLSISSSSRGLISDTGKLFACMSTGPRTNDDSTTLMRMDSGGVPLGSGSLFTAQTSGASNEDSGSVLPFRTSLRRTNGSSHEVVAQDILSSVNLIHGAGSRLATATTARNSLQSSIPQVQGCLAPTTKIPIAMTSFSNTPYNPQTAQSLLSSGIQYTQPALRHSLGIPGLSNHSLAQQLQHKRDAMHYPLYKSYTQSYLPQNNGININSTSINNPLNSNLYNSAPPFKSISRLSSSSLFE